MIDLGLDGEVAVVTGANSPLGIGAAVARTLAEQGVRVVLASLPGQAPESEVAGAARTFAAAGATDVSWVRDALRNDGYPAEAIDIDVSGPTAAAAVLDRAEEVFGPVRILVHSAAHCVPDSYRADTMDMSTVDRHWEVNARGPALFMAEYHRRHRARGADWGRIIALSTDAAAGAADEVSYWASKNALESYTRSAAVEMGGDGVTANIIAPGPVRTGWEDADTLRWTATMSPHGRTGEPADIADAVLLLAARQARWISGQTLYVGGGKRMV